MKHQPQRTCLVCRQVKEKRDLIRVVRTPSGQIIIDPTGKANGRGAYLCRQVSCWQKGLQKERLSRVLKATVSMKDMAILRDYLQTEILNLE